MARLTGIRVKRDTTPNKIRHSASSSTWVLTNPKNSSEFLTEDRVFPTDGPRTFSRCFDRLYIGDVRKETIGRSGFPGLWIFRRPCILGISPVEHQSSLYAGYESSFFLFSCNNCWFIFLCRVGVGSLFNFLYVCACIPQYIIQLFKIIFPLYLPLIHLVKCCKLVVQHSIHRNVNAFLSHLLLPICSLYCCCTSFSATDEDSLELLKRLGFSLTF